MNVKIPKLSSNKCIFMSENLDIYLEICDKKNK